MKKTLFEEIGDNAVITITLLIMQSDINKEGEIGTENQITTLCEKKHFFNIIDLEKYLNSHGFDSEQFKKFNSEEEPERLNYQYEKDGFYYDVDLYVEVYQRDLNTDYLSNFEEEY